MENHEISRYRQLKGPVLSIWRFGLILIPITGLLYILSLHQYLGLEIYGQQYAGWFLAMVLASVFIGVPSGQSRHEDKVPWYDWILTILGLVVGLYIAILYPKILSNFGTITLSRLLLSATAILLIFEALRRMFGWSLVIIVAIFLMYAFVAPYMPGAFRGQATSYDQLLNYLYLDTNSLLDLLQLAATMGLAFILFGSVLLSFKGADIFNNIALSCFGRFRGGPAKASIVGSSLVGSITGGPVANVMLTGNMTIPLMVKTGYTRAQAGAIEAVSSTGGAIMPPIMGVVAFVMAENLNVPYREVALAALVPALIYYICLFAQVDLKAAQNGAGSIPKEQLPPFSRVWKTAWLIVPIFVFLIYLLFVKGLPPTTAGIYSTGFALCILLLQKEVRKNIIERIVETLEETGKSLLEIGVVLAAAGLMVGIIGITGLGFNLVLALTQFGQYGLFTLLVACALVCIILGMGMPALAAYSIVAILVAPSLIDLGVQPMAAHMFVYFFATVSNFTPPIALASFAAAPIAKESPHKISFVAMKLGITAYIVPFVFVYDPSLLLSFSADYEWISLIVSIITSVIACVILSISLVGHLFGPLSPVKRILFMIIAGIMFMPMKQFNMELLLNGLGVLASILLILHERRSNKNRNILIEI